MGAKPVETCYACVGLATTKEHAPPRSFFPKIWKRGNLITVPSCDAHNHDQSEDVEYARNVISTMFGTNAVGQLHFANKSLRSFEHSPALSTSDFCRYSTYFH